MTQDTLQCTHSNVVRRVARDCDRTRFGGMDVLTMTASGSINTPAVRLKTLDQVSDFHPRPRSIREISRLESPMDSEQHIVIRPGSSRHSRLQARLPMQHLIGPLNRQRRLGHL